MHDTREGRGRASAGGLSRGRNFLSPFELLAGRAKRATKLTRP